MGRQNTPKREHGAKSAVPASAQAERTPELLVEAAIRLFAAKGFEGTTVKDISEEAGVNISLISYYFQSKEGLYRTCLEKFGNDRLAVARRLLAAPISFEDLRVRLNMWVDEMFACYLDQTDLVCIIHRECDFGLPVAMDVFKATFVQVFTTLTEFIRSAMERGILRSDLDPMFVSKLLFGTVTYLMRTDKLSERLFDASIRQPEYREQVKQLLLSVFLEGLISKEKDMGVSGAKT